MITEKLKTAQEMAAATGIPASWWYQAAERGEVPSIKIGKYRRFVPSEIDAWLEQQREPNHQAPVNGNGR